MEAREVAELVNRLPCKYEDLNLILKIHIRKSGVGGAPSQSQHQGSRDRQIPRFCGQTA